MARVKRDLKNISHASVLLCVRLTCAGEEGTAHSGAARVARSDVRAAVRRAVRRRAQARHRLRDAGPNGIEAPHRVRAGGARAGRDRIAAPDLSSDASAGADGPYGYDAHLLRG